MLKACCWSGALGFLAILAFSLIGVQARLDGLAPSGNVPALVAKSLGFAASFAMLAVMTSSAASTMDSTFASLSKFVGKDLPILAGRDRLKNPVLVGAFAMIVMAILGNIPMLAGTDILKATTISGTMVIGMAPVFCLHRWCVTVRRGLFIFPSGAACSAASVMPWGGSRKAGVSATASRPCYSA